MLRSIGGFGIGHLRIMFIKYQVIFILIKWCYNRFVGSLSKYSRPS